MQILLGGQSLDPVTGHVVSIQVGGNGPNSAIAVFVILPDPNAAPMAFAIYSDTEPQVFSSIVTLLTVAYDRRLCVTVNSVTKEGGAPQATIVTLPDNNS